jgi:hypothetical protein
MLRLQGLKCNHLTLGLCAIAVTLCLVCIDGYRTLGPSGASSTDNVVSLRSPNGEWDALLFTRDSGATSNWSSHVSIVPAGSRAPNDVGNIFSCWGHHRSGTPAAMIMVTWESPRELLIAWRNEGQDCWKHETAWGQIQIAYQER